MIRLYRQTEGCGSPLAPRMTNTGSVALTRERRDSFTPDKALGDPHKKLQVPSLGDVALPPPHLPPLPSSWMLPGSRLTKATVPVVRQDKVRWAEAIKASGAVGTGAKKAQVGLFGALVDVWRGRHMK